MKQIIALFLISLLVIGCKQKKNGRKTEKPDKSNLTEGESAVKEKAKQVGVTYHAANFTKKKAIHFDVELDSNGQKKAKARVILTTDFKHIKVSQGDGTTLFYNDGQTTVTPSSAADHLSKNDLWKWVELFSMPYRLTKTAVNYAGHGSDTLWETPSQTLHLERKQGGETKQIKLYTDRRTGFLTAVRYRDKRAAPFKQGTVVRYNTHFSLKEFPIAKYWTFYRVNPENNQPDKKVALATLSRVRFVSPPAGYFKPPKNKSVL